MLSGFALEIPLDLVGKRGYAPWLPEWVFFFFFFFFSHEKYGMDYLN